MTAPGEVHKTQWRYPGDRPAYRLAPCGKSDGEGWPRRWSYRWAAVTCLTCLEMGGRVTSTPITGAAVRRFITGRRPKEH